MSHPNSVPKMMPFQVLFYCYCWAWIRGTPPIPNETSISSSLFQWPRWIILTALYTFRYMLGFSTISAQDESVEVSEKIQMTDSQILSASQPIKISLSDCLAFLDERLLLLTWNELREVTFVSRKAIDSRRHLVELSTFCRANTINLSAPLAAKVLRLWDLLDSLPPFPLPGIINFGPTVDSSGNSTSPGNSAPVNNLTMNCPDYEVIMQYVLKMKTKLKQIEEMVASKKLETVKFKPSSNQKSIKLLNGVTVFDLSLVRDEVKNMQSAVDTLEACLLKAIGVMQYIASMKQLVHKPFQSLLVVLSALPPLEAAEEILSAASDAFETSEISYREACNQQILMQSAQAQRDLNYLFSQLVIEIRPLTSISGAEKEDVARELKQSNSRDAAGELANIILSNTFEETLRQLFEQCPITELEDVLCGFNVSVSKVTRGKSSLSDEQLENALAVVGEFKLRQVSIEEVYSSTEFHAAFSALRTTRSQAQQSLLKYQRALGQYRGLMEKHFDAVRQLEQFKANYKQIMRGELLVEVSID